MGGKDFVRSNYFFGHCDGVIFDQRSSGTPPHPPIEAVLWTCKGLKYLSNGWKLAEKVFQSVPREPTFMFARQSPTACTPTRVATKTRKHVIRIRQADVSERCQVRPSLP